MQKSLTLLDSMGEVVSVAGTPVPGAGWYGPTTGLHSVSIMVLNFTGRVSIMASLAAVPSANDWFSVLPNGVPYIQYPQAGFVPQLSSSGETSHTGFNFICNAVWVVANVDRSYLINGAETPMQLSYYGVVGTILLNY